MIYDDAKEYFIKTIVKSDTEKEIDSWISLQPKINVNSYDPTVLETQSSPLLQNQRTTENITTPSDVEIEMTNEHNIPSGFQAEMYYTSGVYLTGKLEARAEALQKWYYTNSSAKALKTTVKGSDRMSFYYQGKGCCWYNNGFWVDRGNITHYGPNYSYTFTSVPKYTTYLGVKSSVLTTLSAIKTVVYTPYY